MPSTDEINAGFDAAMPDLHMLIQQFVPYFFRDQVDQALMSHKPNVVAIVRNVLAAAEHARAKAKT